MFELLATCCPGLEAVLAGEIAETLGAAAATRRGAAVFRLDRPAGALALGCADNLYARLGEAGAPATRAGLAAMGRALAALPVAETLDGLGLPWRGARAHVSASRAGRHSYSRFEAAEAALTALCAALGLPAGTAEDHAVAFRLDVLGDRAELAVKLTGADFRFRGRRAFSPAALRPTVARALVRLTAPAPADAFLDPFCGSGTVLAERLAFPARAVLGGDVDPAALSSARENLGPRADLRLWDARALPLDGGSVTAIATNPPWGGQIALDDEDGLYGGFLAEAARVLDPGGALVVLTDRAAALERACAALGLAPGQPLTLSLHGAVCGIWKMSFKEGVPPLKIPPDMLSPGPVGLGRK